MLLWVFKEPKNSNSIITGFYHFNIRNSRPFHQFLHLTYFLKQASFIFSIDHFDIFKFQIMKFLSTIFATNVIVTSGFVFESMNRFQTNQALFIDDPLQPSEPLVPRSRSKRDLIGFNRQGNNIFSHRRQWKNPMGMLFKRKSTKPCKVVVKYSHTDIKIQKKISKQ